jgi:hypothetical protein
LKNEYTRHIGNEGRSDENFRISSFEESEKAEREYWRSRTPEERMLALEMMRRIAYGYDEDSPGLQRVLEITERP